MNMKRVVQRTMGLVGSLDVLADEAEEGGYPGFADTLREQAQTLSEAVQVYHHDRFNREQVKGLRDEA